MQSALPRHWTHLPVGAQWGVVGVPAQSACVRHWTHVANAMLHFGLGAEHWLFEVQALTHWRRFGSQWGVADGQFASAMQPTHRCWPGWHRGVSPPHWASAVQATHWLVVRSQALLAPVQSALPRHPRHRPVAASQSGASLGQLLFGQRSSHVCSRGQHAFDGQSAFVRHSSHVPAMQNLSEPVQSPFDVQATHPSAGSHLDCVHCRAPLKPQRALPAPVTFTFTFTSTFPSPEASMGRQWRSAAQRWR